MADRIIETGITSIVPDPANVGGWIVIGTAMAVTGDGLPTTGINTEIPVAASDTIAQWEAKRRDAYRLAVGKPTAPVILITYKVAP